VGRAHLKEVALSETGDDGGPQKHDDEAPEKDHERWRSVIEVIEVIVLALVAVATAWSGYQASRWGGRQTELYGIANGQRFQANADSTYGGQELAANAGIFTAWLEAHAENNVQLQSLYASRFTPDYKIAFEAWLATDPFTNPKAPAGPAVMPQYKNTYLSRASRLNAEASKTFDEGTSARGTSDSYVRFTVLLASVLFLVALAQRLTVRAARVGLNTVAFGVFVYSIIGILTLARL
jgi:hypothetical protein